MEWSFFKPRKRFRLPTTDNQFLLELLRTRGEDDSVVCRRVSDLLVRMRIRRAIERRLWLLKALVHTAWAWIKPRLGKAAVRIRAFETWLFDKLKRQEKKNADSADHHDN